MPTIVAVNDGLQARLATITGLEVFDHVPDNFNPPAALLPPPEISYDRTMGRGTIELAYQAVVFIPHSDTESGQKLLLEYAAPTGAKSIDAAINADRTLGFGANGGVDAHVVRFRPLGIEEINAYGYLGGSFDIAAYVRGTS